MESIFVKFSKYPTIETERLLLRPVTLDDAEAMFEYASDRENTRYTFPTNQSLEETKNNIAQFYLASPLGRWGIELKNNGKFIGTIDLHKIDTVLKKAAIGYIINKKYWYDWNTMWEYSTNYHNHQYISIPLWSILSIKLAEDGITIVMRS